MTSPWTPSQVHATTGPASKPLGFELARGVVGFCRFARANGLDSGIKGTIDSVRAVKIVDHGGLDTFRCALRTVLCASKKEWDIFDQLFDAFWCGRRMDPPKPTNRPSDSSTVNARRSRGAFLMLGDPASKEPREIEKKRKTVTGANAIDRLGKTDFLEVPQDDLAELEHLSVRLLRRMSLRLSRRLKVTHFRARVDLRRTIRVGAARGGDFIELCYRGRRTQAIRLVILLDVSDSMNPYSLFLFKFAYALGKHFDQAACFVFSTRLVDVSKALKAKDLPDALTALSAINTFWSGGTKIGSSLREFNLGYGRRMRSTDTAVVILSDGWETGEPDALIRELKTLKQRAKRLIWLNPLLGLDQYEPVTRGMSAALPYIDVFAPAHNLQSLLQLERHLAWKFHEPNPLKSKRKCLTSS